MKKSLFFAGVAAALCLVGCNKEVDIQGHDATPFEVILNMAETRTVTDGIHTEWAEGDKINVFHAEAGTADYKHDTPYSEGTQHPYVVSDTENGVFQGSLMGGDLDQGKSYDWYFFYPYNSYYNSPVNTAESGSYVYVGGRSDRTQTQNGYNSRTHLAGGTAAGCFPLYGIKKNVPADEQPVVTMKHIASAVAVNVKNTSTAPITISEVSFTAPEAIVGQFYISFEKEPLAFEPHGYSNATATLAVENPGQLAVGETASFYIGIKPFTAKAGDKLSLKIHADAGIVEKEITLPAAVEFKSGLVKSLNIDYANGQAVSASSLAEILSMDANEDVVTQEVLVVAKYARGVMLGQGETYLLAFNSAGVDAAIGDIVTVSGKVGEYAGLKQIANPEVTVISSGNEVVLPAPKVLESLDDYSSDKVELIQYTGTLAISSSYYNVNVAGSTRKGSIQYPLDAEALKALDGKAITATGFFTGLTGSGSYVNMMSTSVEEAAIPLFDVESRSISVAATETSAEIHVTGNVDWTVTPGDGILSADPLSGTGEGTVTVTFEANASTEEAKEYSVIIGTDASVEDDEIEVIITQAKAVSLDGNQFVKVADGLVSGQYLIVSEDGGVAMKDAADVGGGSNTISVTVNGGVIAATDELKAALFTFDLTTGYIQGPNGKYIGQTSDANGLKVQDSGIANTITITDGDADIVSGGAHLRYNANAGDSNLRFRYYKSASYQNQKPVQLYKLSDGAPAPVASLVSISLSGQTTEYNVGDTFAFDGTVTATYSDGSSKTVQPTSVSTPDMATAGTKEVTVSYTEGEVTKTASYDITVSETGTPVHTITIADFGSVSFTAGAYSITAAKADASNEPTYNATGKDLRVYAKGTLTVSNSKENITKIVFNLSSQGMKRLAPITASTGTVAAQTKGDAKVTWTGDAREVVFTVGEKAEYGSDGDTKAGQLCFTTIDVAPWSEGDVQPKTLSSLEVSGQKTAFTVGDTFEFGGTATAVYSDGSRTVVTDDVAFSGYDMATVGTQTVTATYQTVSTTYEITVSEAHTPTEGADVLNQEFTGITGTTYSEFSGKVGTSGAVYAGQCAGGNSSIQLRSNNNNSGIVTTGSGGKVKKVVVDWNSNTVAGRTLNIYGKNTAYTAATDLYDTEAQGTLLGTIVMGTSTELTIDGDYTFIGFRSDSGAMYLTTVEITWK